MIDYEGFFASLEIMWKGMGGLFLVCIFIMLLVRAAKFFMRKDKTAEKQQGT